MLRARSKSAQRRPQRTGYWKAITRGPPILVDDEAQGSQRRTLDIPSAIAAIGEGERLTLSSWRLNAEEALRRYEECIVDHVLSQQIPSNELARITRRNLATDGKEGGKTFAGTATLAESSLLGRDPFGEEPTKEMGDNPQEKGLMALIADIQDKAWLQATTWWKKLVSPDIRTIVGDMERTYREKEKWLERQPRGRIP